MWQSVVNPWQLWLLMCFWKYTDCRYAFAVLRGIAFVSKCCCWTIVVLFGCIYYTFYRCESNSRGQKIRITLETEFIKNISYGALQCFVPLTNWLLQSVGYWKLWWGINNLIQPQNWGLSMNSLCSNNWLISENQFKIIKDDKKFDVKHYSSYSRFECEMV